MTNNPTIDGVLRLVPVEMLERLVKGTPNSSWDALDNDRLAATEELRALLAAPAVERQLIVLPPYKYEFDLLGNYHHGWTEWNACIDKTKEMNQ